MINMTDNSQTFSRGFDECETDEGVQVSQKIVRMSPVKTIKASEVFISKTEIVNGTEVKSSGFQNYEIKNLDCDASELF